jgi:hypothetical protein
VTGIVLAALLSASIAPVAQLSPSPIDPCAASDLPANQKDSQRNVTAHDLVELADIGRADSNESESPFGISPDGTRIAFVVRRANAQANDYCQRLLVARLDAKGVAREVDRGGEFIRRDVELRKFVSIMAGSAKVIVPRWSPDGMRIAYLKKQGKTHQVWLADPLGRAPAVQASYLPDNVDDFAWVRDGSALVVATRPGIRLQAEAIAQESRDGFLFGDRFAPQIGDRPIPVEPVETEYRTVALATGEARAATPAETALLRREQPTNLPEGASGFVRGPGDRAAWREKLHTRRLLSPSGLAMQLPSGRMLRCGAPCSGVRKLWWAADGSRLYALQIGSFFYSRTALLSWKIGDPAPNQIFVTDDVLVGCALPAAELICARESTLRPRRLVAIDPDTGRERLVFDPNPDFGQIRLGSVQRFRFRNAFGVESNADLVLPPNHKAGETHPLVVVQYHSQGFLRGGTGDEFPIQLLAAKGFAVLSFTRPDPVPEAMAATNEQELNKASSENWADRRSVQSSLDLALRQAIETGTIDVRRMGISGFSDGTATVQWALINSEHFKVAAVGTCCEGFNAYPLAAGPVFTQEGRDSGDRFFEAGVEDHWRPLSLTLNVDRIAAPILIQTSDSEYEGGLDVVETFRQRGKPIEMFVFEDEPHIKYQPAHRLAIYERSTEWFQFWLKAVMNCDPVKAAQYERWKAMKGAPDIKSLRCEQNISIAP